MGSDNESFMWLKNQYKKTRPRLQSDGLEPSSSAASEASQGQGEQAGSMEQVSESTHDQKGHVTTDSHGAATRESAEA